VKHYLYEQCKETSDASQETSPVVMDYILWFLPTQN